MVTPVEGETGKVLMQVFRLLHEGLVEETFAEVNRAGERLTPAQYEVLRFVDRHEEPTIGELAEGLGISSAAATKAVTGLAERPEPLVQRTRGDDRRTVRIKTTAAGAALASEVRELFNGRLEGVLSRLSHADREQLDHGLKALLHAALLSPADCEAACLRCGVDRTEDCVVHIAELTFQHHRSAR